jgi:Ca-activated chloride channel family protein
MFDRAGIVTTTLGVGTDFDENTMLSIAREGSGSYEFVRRPADIAPILTEELDERAMAVAQDLRLRIELSPGVSLARVYGSRVLNEAEEARVRATEVAVDDRVARELGIPRDRQHDDDTGLRMHIPSFRRGDQHVVLLELVVPPGTGDTELARVSLDFKDLRDQANGHSAVTIHAERTSDLERADQSVRRPVKRTVLAFQAGDTLRNASEALAVGDSLRAAQLLDERIALLDAASRLWHDTAMTRDAHLLTSYRRAIGGAWQDWDTNSQHTLVLAMGYYGDQRME